MAHQLLQDIVTLGVPYTLTLAFALLGRLALIVLTRIEMIDTGKSNNLDSTQMLEVL